MRELEFFRGSPDREEEREDIMLLRRRFVPRNVRTPRVERTIRGTDNNILACCSQITKGGLRNCLDQVSDIDIWRHHDTFK